MARPVSDWVHTSETAQELPSDAANAIAAASSAPGQVATLIVPADCAWAQASGPAASVAPRPPMSVSAARVDDIAKVLRARDEPALLLLSGGALGDEGIRSAQRIAAATGARVLMSTFPARVERGAGRLAIDRLAYFPEQIMSVLEHVAHLVLVEIEEPVSFFAYPGAPSRPIPEGCRVHVLARPDENGTEALAALVEALAAKPVAPLDAPLPGAPDGALDPQSLGAIVARLQPENGIVSDESATSGLGYFLASTASPPHTYLALTGGAIGQGLPCATGAAIACPERTVIALQADGGGMYTVQALWTQARESLNVKTIICANQEYRVLRWELARAGVQNLGPAATALTDLGNPALDWVSLARGMGVPGAAADTAEGFTQALGRALATPGPYLIEARL